MRRRRRKPDYQHIHDLEAELGFEDPVLKAESRMESRAAMLKRMSALGLALTMPIPKINTSKQTAEVVTEATNYVTVHPMPYALSAVCASAYSMKYEWLNETFMPRMTGARLRNVTTIYDSRGKPL